MSAGFLQERQVQPCTGFGGVSHVSLDTPRCVSCIRRKHRQVSWQCAVFSGWRARCVCGACEVSLTSCSSATDDLFLFAVVDGTVEISRMRILRNCTCRGTPGAFGPCTAPRTSQSPSSLRACHSRVHGYMGQCGVSQVARGLT